MQFVFFLKRVATNCTFPFDLPLPNAKTFADRAETENPQTRATLKPYESLTQMNKNLLH